MEKLELRLGASIVLAHGVRVTLIEVADRRALLEFEDTEGAPIRFMEYLHGMSWYFLKNSRRSMGQRDRLRIGEEARFEIIEISAECIRLKAL